MRKAHVHPTVIQRVQSLEQIETDLSYRTDLKIRLGCGETPKELSRVQERVFAQIYGLRGVAPDKSSSNYLFRWLMAHTGQTRYDFRPKNAAHYQWPKIIARYFDSPGHFAELVILEKILLAILRSRKPYPVTDVFMADRIGDTQMKTDWIFHRQLKRGLLQMGIQVSIGNHVKGKVADILKKPISDISVFGSTSSPMVQQFLRHTTAVISFPHFPVSESQRKAGYKNLITGSREYQSRGTKVIDESFGHYARWIEEIITVLDEGVKNRMIDRYPHHVRNVSYDTTLPSGNKVRLTLENIGGEQVAILELFCHGVPKKKSRPMIFALPLRDDFLNIYRDMLGVRAQ